MPTGSTHRRWNEAHEHERSLENKKNIARSVQQNEADEMRKES
jgi:hypothetical protein